MTKNGRPVVEIVTLSEGWQRDEVVSLNLVLAVVEGRCERGFKFSRAQPTAANRNGIAKRFLEGDADYLLMIDHDQAFDPQQNPLDYVQRDLDVVGFPTPLYKVDGSLLDPIRWNIWLETPNGKRVGGMMEVGTGLTEVAAIGTGAMLIARRVLEHPDMRAPFRDEFDEDGIRTRGEDLTFCERARAAGFHIYAAMDMPCGHIKEVDLLHMMRILDAARKQGSAPMRPLRDIFTGRRLIFCVSPGRCGTAYLAQALNSITDVVAEHESEPSFRHRLHAAQIDPAEALRFWINEKLPAISAIDTQAYADTTHLFGQGYAEALLDLDIVPDLIVLRRPHREVALSMWRRRAIPGRTDFGSTYHVAPNHPTVWPIRTDWELWTDYQVCYWFCLEMERRAQLYAEMYRRRGARVYETTLSEIATREGMDSLTDALRLGHVPELPGVINANWPMVADKLPAGDLDALERQVREAMCQ